MTERTLLYLYYSQIAQCTTTEISSIKHTYIPERQQDIILAKQLLALSPSAQGTTPVVNEHGVDILLGGHDHLYYVSKGAGEWVDYDKTQEVLGAEEDKGDILVFKSGYDFKDLGELMLELEDTPEDSVRRKVIKNVTGMSYAPTAPETIPRR